MDIPIEHKKEIVWEQLKQYPQTYLASLCLAMMTDRDIEVAYKDIKAKKHKSR